VQPLHVELMIQECADLQWPVKCSQRCEKGGEGCKGSEGRDGHG